jgi:hypothetical protein
MFETRDPHGDVNFTVEHCYDPETLRRAIGIVLSRILRMQEAPNLDDAQRDELFRWKSCFVCLGVPPIDEAIGRRDPTEVESAQRSPRLSGLSSHLERLGLR